VRSEGVTGKRAAETGTQNVTLALPRALLRKVKVVAATRDTSISALLTSALEDVVREDDVQRRAMRRALARVREGYDLGTGGQLTIRRDDLHAR
jgi:predicted transcriptional regulator